MKKQLLVLFVLPCLLLIYGCGRNPYALHYLVTEEGLQETVPPQKLVIQRCVKETYEARTEELLAEGYVNIGCANFVSDYAVHPQIGRHAKEFGAEVILYTVSQEAIHMENYIRIYGAGTRPVTMYRHEARYFAMPLAGDQDND